jgi:chromosome segregation ATPase
MFCCREKIDKELANYQAGVRELRQACEKPINELGDLQSQHAKLSDQASSLQQSKQELLTDLSFNSIAVGTIEKAVGSLRQLVEDAVETIQVCWSTMIKR